MSQECLCISHCHFCVHCKSESKSLWSLNSTKLQEYNHVCHHNSVPRLVYLRLLEYVVMHTVFILCLYSNYSFLAMVSLSIMLNHGKVTASFLSLYDRNTETKWSVFEHFNKIIINTLYHLWKCSFRQYILISMDY